MAKKIITNLHDMVSSTATAYIFANKDEFKSETPGPRGFRGFRGFRGADGVDGTSVEITSVINNPNKSLTINFSDGTQHTTDPLKGQDGESITITNVINNANGTMLINFSDGTSHHTMDLRGQRGFKGDTGDHVHHISYQRSKDPLGNEVGPVNPGQPGYDDTYAMWLSQEELPEMYVGEFVVHNGLDGLPSEDQDKIDSIEFGATRDQIASEVPFNNTSTGFVASNVQTALVELETGKEDKSDKGMPNGYAGLGVDGKVSSTQMPTYVTSVAGKTGVVTLEKGDVGLGNVQNVDTTNATNISSGTLNTSRLANSGVTAGTYKSVTTDAKGRITAGTNPTTVAGYGLTDVYTKTESDAVLTTKAPLASPTFIGVPKAPTASVGTNTTQLATTAFVVAEINKIEEW